ncbi:response regulator transcription factor [Candidatus Leptofilum sp.]|uniref:response regulator transcription factor n=1 Tax=Candidatus Leptofilum sp. TaxID=3241576 RepID=UPI003B58ED4F
MTKILIAEDDQDIRELVVLTLQFSGFDVTPVEDGSLAVEKAKTENFDLILMDVRMPRMTGYEACRRLKAMDATKDIPIIFLSAKGQEQEIQTGLDVGAADYILKPFAPDTLVNTINKVLNENPSEKATEEKES